MMIKMKVESSWGGIKSSTHVRHRWMRDAAGVVPLIKKLKYIVGLTIP